MTIQYFELPTIPFPQRFSVSLNKVVYNLRLDYRSCFDIDGTQIGGWIMDISDANDNKLACGLPLVTGADLIAQFKYLGIGGSLLATSDVGMWDVPTFDDMGTVGHLFFATDAAQ